MEFIKVSEISENLKLLKKRGIDGFDLYAVIAQDYKTNEILMVAYANDETIRKTFETGTAHYFSTTCHTGNSSCFYRKIENVGKSEA